MTGRSSRALKYAGMAILVIPIAILLLFTIGEVAGGDISGLGHLLQVFPIIVLAIAAWKWPRIAGLFLIGLGILLAAIYPFVFSHLRFEVVLITEVMLFLPPIVSGTLLLLSTRQRAG